MITELPGRDVFPTAGKSSGNTEERWPDTFIGPNGFGSSGTGSGKTAFRANGQLVERGKGTPQGGVISPLPANIFMHHTTDEIALSSKTRMPKNKFTFTKFRDIVCKDFFFVDDSILPILGISNNPL